MLDTKKWKKVNKCNNNYIVGYFSQFVFLLEISGIPLAKTGMCIPSKSMAYLCFKISISFGTDTLLDII